MKNELERIIFFKIAEAVKQIENMQMASEKIVSGSIVIGEVVKSIMASIIFCGYVKKSELMIDEKELKNMIIFHLESGGWCLMSTYLNSGDVDDLARAISQSSSSLIVEKGEK